MELSFVRDHLEHGTDVRDLLEYYQVNKILERPRQQDH